MSIEGGVNNIEGDASVDEVDYSPLDAAVAFDATQRRIDERMENHDQVRTRVGCALYGTFAQLIRDGDPRELGIDDHHLHANRIILERKRKRESTFERVEK